MGKYPWNSPFAFSENRLIDSREIEGLESAVATFSYRVTAVLVTGSVSVSAGLDYKGNVSLFWSWSAGLGGGAYAGGGLSWAIYPTAKLENLTGGGVNFGANVGLPGVSFGGDLSLSLQTTKGSKGISGIKAGGGASLKVGSVGPGGAEFHVDYSTTYQLLPTMNVFTQAKDIVNYLEENFNMTSDEANRFVKNLQITVKALKEEKVKQDQAKKQEQAKKEQSKKAEKKKENKKKTKDKS